MCNLLIQFSPRLFKRRGHLARMNSSKTQRKIVDGSISGQRRRARPQSPWIDEVEKDTGSENFI